MTRPMRAATLEETDFHKLRFPLIGSPKIDGIRAVSTERGLLSKSLKPIPNRYVQSFEFPPGLDGELLIGSVGVDDTFDLTRRGVMTVSGEPDFRYIVFDRWDSDEDYDIRLSSLMYVCSLKVERLEYRVLHDLEDLLSYERYCLSLGYEGIMLRRHDGKYKCGESTLNEQYLMKFKRFADDEAVIVDIFEEEANGNEAIVNEVGLAKRSSHQANKIGKGIAGSLICVSHKFKNEFGVSGFDKRLAREIWENQDAWLGQTITYKYQAYGSTEDAPRIPKYKGIRHSEDM